MTQRPSPHPMSLKFSDSLLFLFYKQTKLSSTLSLCPAILYAWKGVLPGQLMSILGSQLKCSVFRELSPVTCLVAQLCPTLCDPMD